MTEKCKNCMHLLKDYYCKAYKVELKMIDVSKCKRKKVK